MSKITIERFYAAFAKLDANTMQACYAPNATFDDEAFSLNGAQEIGGMWRMLCEATKSKPEDRKSTRLNSSHLRLSRMPSSA